MKTIVVFRKWANGDIIALFPAEASDYRGLYCDSYEHNGQHGAADYTGVIARTKPASWAEYQPLKRELQGIPFEYELDVRRRASPEMHMARRASAMKVYKAPMPALV